MNECFAHLRLASSPLTWFDDDNEIADMCFGSETGMLSVTMFRLINAIDAAQSSALRLLNFEFQEYQTEHT
jgi:hypothetical protein